MKLSGFLVFCMALLVSGCESMSSRVEDRFSGVPPHSRIFAADQRTVYYAAQLALKNSGLLLGRTSIARGRIDGYAPIRSGDVAQNTRQTTIEIRLFETEALDTRVEVLVWDHQEGSFPGGVSEQAFKDHSLYENYYAALQQVLKSQGALKTVAKP